MRNKIISFFAAGLLFQAGIYAQSKIENVIVVTTDGLRWQELFKGMDTALANNAAFNQNQKEAIYTTYWSDDAQERRKKLMPFMWNTIAVNGQLYGNRTYNNFVNTANPYWFSYPGYNEMFTGFPDTSINSNSHPDNPHLNVFEFMNQQPGYKNKVAAFGSWEAYNRILRKKQSGFPVIAAFDTIDWKNATPAEKLIDAMKRDSYKPDGDWACMDVFTQYQAMEYLKTKHPKLLYISYLETDERAHGKMYKDYLDAARQVDVFLKQVWDFVQSTPAYKNKTALLVTTDHGRGDIKKEEWTSHGSKIEGADQIWIAVMGPGIPPNGEIKKSGQLYQKQIAQTISSLLGFTFTAVHPIAEPIQHIKESK